MKAASLEFANASVLLLWLMQYMRSVPSAGEPLDLIDRDCIARADIDPDQQRPCGGLGCVQELPGAAMVFTNRAEAGKRLAGALAQQTKFSDFVLADPDIIEVRY